MKIPIKKYTMDETLSWEDRYQQLEKHHQEEMWVLVEEIKRLEKIIQDYCFAHDDDSLDADLGFEPLTVDDDERIDPKLDTNSTIDDRIGRLRLKCSYCPPHQGENARPNSNYGAKKKRKNR